MQFSQLRTLSLILFLNHLNIGFISFVTAAHSSFINTGRVRSLDRVRLYGGSLMVMARGLMTLCLMASWRGFFPYPAHTNEG